MSKTYPITVELTETELKEALDYLEALAVDMCGSAQDVEDAEQIIHAKAALIRNFIKAVFKAQQQ